MSQEISGGGNGTNSVSKARQHGNSRKLKHKVCPQPLADVIPRKGRAQGSDCIWLPSWTISGCPHCHTTSFTGRGLPPPIIVWPVPVLGLGASEHLAIVVRWVLPRSRLTLGAALWGGGGLFLPWDPGCQFKHRLKLNFSHDSANHPREF